MEILHDLKMQFVDLLLVMWIFWGQIGHKNYEDFALTGRIADCHYTQGAALG